MTHPCATDPGCIFLPVSVSLVTAPLISRLQHLPRKLKYKLESYYNAEKEGDECLKTH